jgi:hypothetical protein
MITFAILAVALVTSVIAGAIALLRAGIGREESERSFLAEPPTLAAAVTRRVVGLYVRTPQRLAPDEQAADPGEADLAGRHTTAWTGR